MRRHGNQRPRAIQRGCIRTCVYSRRSPPPLPFYHSDASPLIATRLFQPSPLCCLSSCLPRTFALSHRPSSRRGFCTPVLLYGPRRSLLHDRSTSDRMVFSLSWLSGGRGLTWINWINRIVRIHESLLLFYPDTPPLYYPWSGSYLSAFNHLLCLTRKLNLSGGGWRRTKKRTCKEIDSIILNWSVEIICCEMQGCKPSLWLNKY